jgi:hypothetical protein
MKGKIALLAIALMATQASYANDDVKLSTVENMYNEALAELAADEDYDLDKTLYKYADRNLQQAISMVTSNSTIQYDDGSSELTECFDAVEAMKLVEGNGYMLNDADHIDYSMVSKGRVRAESIFPDGMGGYDKSYKDFSLTCDANECKVSDIYDFNGDSAKLIAEKLCR